MKAFVVASRTASGAAAAMIERLAANKISLGWAAVLIAGINPLSVLVDGALTSTNTRIHSRRPIPFKASFDEPPR